MNNFPIQTKAKYPKFSLVDCVEMAQFYPSHFFVVCCANTDLSANGTREENFETLFAFYGNEGFPRNRHSCRNTIIFSTAYIHSKSSCIIKEEELLLYIICYAIL